MSAWTITGSLALIGAQLWLYRRQRLRYPEQQGERASYSISWPTRIFASLKGPFYAVFFADLLLEPWLRPHGSGAAQAVLGLGLAGGGLWLFAAAMAALGRNFAPCDRAELPFERVTSGPYRFCPHPMYAGNLLLFLGVAIATGSVGVALCTLVLAVFYAFSIRDEDRALAARFPDRATVRVPERSGAQRWIW